MILQGKGKERSGLQRVIEVLRALRQAYMKENFTFSQIHVCRAAAEGVKEREQGEGDAASYRSLMIYLVCLWERSRGHTQKTQN